MDISFYYQILDTGIVYEKGRKSGKLWKIGERKRLKEVLLFWQKVLEYIEKEKEGKGGSKELFDSLEKLCTKYKFPNYERVLEKRDILENSNSKFISDCKEEKIRNFIKCLLLDMQKQLDVYKNKEMVYQILRVLHNLPKAMHGKNILNDNPTLVSYEEALNRAKSCMNEEMKKIYEQYML